MGGEHVQRVGHPLVGRANSDPRRGEMIDVEVPTHVASVITHASGPISTLVTSNIVGEASRIGFGSALATMMLLISSVFIVFYLRIVMREQR